MLGNTERLISCSCASGPAFEGGHIRQGMQASEGAIEHATIDPDTLHIHFRTVGSVAPRGLCGSGIIDVVAGMLRAGIIDTKGMIRCDGRMPHVRINDDGEPEFVLTTSRSDVIVAQRDIAAIQLAKAAIFAGITILTREMKIDIEQIKRIYLAGAFGASIDPINAMTIGLIPPIPQHAMKNVGNVAVSGAKMALLSRKQMQRCEAISKSVEYIELAAHPAFQAAFFDALRFASQREGACQRESNH